MKDIHGLAIRDHYQGKQKGPLILHNSYGEPEEMPVEVFFRDEIDFTTLEHLAIMESLGTVLDLGAGAGAHALVLQGRGHEVFALDNSPCCAEVMRQSGVLQVVQEDYQKHRGQYDTVLMLMNGLGIAGKISAIPGFIKKCLSLLKPNGQILFDSSDISYLYDDSVQKPKDYFGEIRYQYEYNGEKGDWFDWVYADQNTMSKICTDMGLNLEILHTDENDQYLGCITC